MSTSKTCPCLEDLSAWHDDELTDTAETVAEHLAECEDCDGTVKTFARLDDAVSRVCACDEQRAERIASTCVDELSQRARPAARIVPLRVWLRVAAAIVIVAVLVQMSASLRRMSREMAQAPAPAAAEHAALPVVDGGGSSELTPLERKIRKDILAARAAEAKPAAARPSIPTAPAVAAHVPRTKSNTARLQAVERRAVKDTSARALNSCDIKLVSTNAGDAAFGRPHGASLRADKPRAVGDFVHHVWLVDNAAQPLKALRPILPQHDALIRHWIDQGLDSYRLQLTISDRELQGLVNRFDSLGYGLLSPAAPQPGRFQDVEFSGKTVLYEVDFVAR